MKVKEQSEKVGLKLNIQKTKIMASGPIASWQIDGETVETVTDFIFLGSQITADGGDSHEIKRRLLLGRKVMTNLDSIFKSRDITLPTRVCLVKAMVFSSNHVWLWELDYKESWVPKIWYFWTAVLKKTLQSSLDCKEIQPVHPKGNQSWIFIGRTDTEAETPILWPPNAKTWLIWKDPDAGKNWGQEEKGTTDDKMVGWHHWLNGHGFGWTPGIGNVQGGLVGCGSWGRKESNMTERLNWTELNWTELKTNRLPVISPERLDLFQIVRKLQCGIGYYISHLHFLAEQGKERGKGSLERYSKQSLLLPVFLAFHKLSFCRRTRGVSLLPVGFWYCLKAWELPLLFSWL